MLYPEDSTPQGKELRLQQQYFFVSASIHDFIDSVLPPDFDLTKLPDRVIFQLNDTHPVIGVPELMRVLVDEKDLEWDEAWAITKQCFAYTCHTLLPEALEVWSADLLGRLLPRHLEIIYRINDEFLDEVRERFGDDELRIRRMSIIAEHPGARRSGWPTWPRSPARRSTASPSCTPSCCATRCCPTSTSSIRASSPTSPTASPRAVSSGSPTRRCPALITDAIGVGWLTDLERLRELEPYAEDEEFRERFREVKAHNKRRLSRVLRRPRRASPCDRRPPARRDGQAAARVQAADAEAAAHRHALRADHVRRGRSRPTSSRGRSSFGAKAAPGYRMAKDIIHLINAVGSVVNADPAVEGRLKVLFPPNYNVTLAEKVIPAADLSEQISLAGKEASGTGNMKFALNGALTIGTDDGANIEIRELVGDDNFFLFGLLEPEVEALFAKGYVPSSFYESDDEPAQRDRPDRARARSPTATAACSTGWSRTCSTTTGSWRWPTIAAYIDAQDEVDAAYADEDGWTRSAILNVARTRVLLLRPVACATTSTGSGTPRRRFRLLRSLSDCFARASLAPRSAALQAASFVASCETVKTLFHTDAPALEARSVGRGLYVTLGLQARLDFRVRAATSA